MSEGRQVEVHALRRGFVLDMPMFDFVIISMSPVQLSLVGVCAALAIRLHAIFPLMAAIPASRFKLEHVEALKEVIKKSEKEERRSATEKDKGKDKEKVLKVVGTLRSQDGTPLPFHRFTVYDGSREVGIGITDAGGRYAFYCSARAERLRVSPDAGDSLGRVRDQAPSLLPPR